MYDYRPVYRDETDRVLGRPHRLSTTAFMVWLINYCMFIAIMGTVSYILL